MRRKGPSEEQTSTPSLVDLQKEVAELRTVVDELRRELREWVKVVAEWPHLRKTNISDKLTPEQETIFQELEAIQGNDETAQRCAEKLLAKLKGQRITHILVDRLKQYLHDRQWGILEVSGVAAGPVWQPDPGRPMGGYMRLGFTDPQSHRSMKTQSFSYFPKVHIVPRPDRRRICNLK